MDISDILDTSTPLGKTIIDRESKSVLQTTNTDRLEDIFMLITQTNKSVHSLSNRILLIEQKLDMLLQEMQAQTSICNNISAIAGSAVYTNSGNNDDDMIIEPSKDAQTTKKVSKEVVVAVIASMWYQHKGINTPFPVERDYLGKLCNICFPPFGKAPDKSKIGVLLSNQIASIGVDHNAGSAIVAALLSTQTILSSTMLVSIKTTINRLGGVYAFMLPQDLTELMCRLVQFNKDKFVLDNKPVCTRIEPNKGYNINGLEYMRQSHVIAAFKNTVSVGTFTTSDAKRLARCIERREIDTNGNLKSAGNSVAPSLFSQVIRDNTRRESEHNIQLPNPETIPSKSNGSGIDLSGYLSPSSVRRGAR